jgi:pilus assembly protein Flp/PilA
VFLAMMNSVKTFFRGEDGPTAVEYAVMLALIIVVCVVAITALGNAANAPFEIVSDTIPTASP